MDRHGPTGGCAAGDDAILDAQRMGDPALGRGDVLARRSMPRQRPHLALGIFPVSTATHGRTGRGQVDGFGRDDLGLFRQSVAEMEEPEADEIMCAGVDLGCSWMIGDVERNRIASSIVPDCRKLLETRSHVD